MQLTDAPGKLVLPFADAGAKNAIPVASQIGITAGAASLTDGFPPLTRTPLAAGGTPPSGLDMNGVLFELSAILRWANAGAGYVYDGTFAADANVDGYPKGARVLRSDGLGYWFNTVDDNTTDPEGAGAVAAGWVPDFTTGASAITMTGSNVTLTALEYGKPVIVISGLLTANLNLIFPDIVGRWVVINNTTGAYTITCKTAAGTGVEVAGVQSIVGDGTDVRLAVTGTRDAGEVCWFARNTAPAGFMKANGAAVSRATYAALFAAIGTTFGVGDGTTTFNLPDLRGEFIRGWDDGRGIDSGRAFGSGQVGTLVLNDKSTGVAAITPHSSTVGADTAAAIGADAEVAGTYPNIQDGFSSATAAALGTYTAIGASRPRNVALLACVKY